MARKIPSVFIGCAAFGLAVNAAYCDDLDSKVKYDQQRTRWAMEETRRKIEADRARMQSQMQQNQNSGLRSQTSSASGTLRSSFPLQTQTASTYGTQPGRMHRPALTPPGLNQATSQAAVQLFQQYKSLDLTNNVQIMNLYSNDAVINVLGTPYTKTSYGQYINAAYHNPASSINSHTRYGEPVVTLAENDTAQLKFVGSLGVNTMTVFWILRRSPQGVWRIASERFVNGVR